jgi:DNA polymerase (family 10)
MENSQYAELLEETADLLQVTGANPFRVRAFQRAARAINGLSEQVDDRLDNESITEVDGIGKSIGEDLSYFRVHGSSPLLDELRASLPDGITELLKVQGLGPKRVKKIYEELGVGTLEELEDVAESGQLETLSGFGKKTAQNIIREIERLKQHRGRTPFGRAWTLASQILAELQSLDEVERADIAGSLRRGRETVGDLDFVVGSSSPGPIMEHFKSLSQVEEVVASGDTKTTVYLRGGVSADLRVVPEEVYGATLHHFTGSKDHNVMMRSRAQKRGLRISEWGVFRVEGDSEERIACHTEEDVFSSVDLPWIAPELREGGEELKAAEEGTLPALVSLEQINSDLHMHTTASDGNQSIDEMAAAAAALGYEYIAITDHSQALSVANGLDVDRVVNQIEAIDSYNEGSPKLRVLKGLEADIMKDGSIDLGADVLERLDWVVGSVHQWMNMSSAEMTDRLVRAVSTGLISAIGHPTGRLIGKREQFPMDFDAVLDACEEYGVALEVNGSPNRLDLNDHLLRRVLERDIWITINTDAHATRTLSQMHFGVRMARRGWTPGDRVLNTLSLKDFLEARRKPERA